MVLACSFQHRTSASYLNWEVLNDSNFKAWVKYFGMSCSGPNAFTSPYTKPSSLVISLIDGYLKVSHAKSTWFARLTRWDRLWQSHICLTTKCWRQIYTRLYQEHSIDNTSIYISGSFYDYPHLELTEKSRFVSRYNKSINMGKGQRNGCKGISKHPFQS